MNDKVIQIVPYPTNSMGGWLHMQDRIYDINGISPTITTWLDHGRYLIMVEDERESNDVEIPTRIF